MKLPKSHTISPRSGITVVIAMFMVLIFMIQMSSILEMTTNSVELHKGYLTTRQAYYNARSGLELGLLSQTDPEAFEEVFQGQGITWTDGKYQLVFSDGSGKSTNKTVSTNSPVPSGVTWEIQNQASDIETKYSITGVDKSINGWQIFPFPGTGTLGAGNCEIEQWKAFKDKSTIGNDDPDLLQHLAPFMGTQESKAITNTLNQANFKFLDHPCLWNTLDQGQAAVIPLYTNGKDCKDFEGNKICNPAEYGANNTSGLDISDLIVKIRTPCADGKKICAPATRYKLNDSGLSSYDTQKVVLWGISATCQINNKTSTCYFTGAGPVNKETPGEAYPGKLPPPFINQGKAAQVKSWITGYVLNHTNKSTELALSDIQQYYALDFSDKYADDLKNLNMGKPTNDASQEETTKYNNWKTKFFDNKPTILKAIKGESPWTTYPQGNPIFNSITKPKLILEIATILKDDSSPSKEIPNLEYQIIYKSGNSNTTSSTIADPVIVADGYHGNFHSKLQVKMSTLGAGFSYVAIPTD